MPAYFALDVTTDTPARRATLRLYDQHGSFVAANEVDLNVAERAAAWMEKHPSERGDRTEAEVWAAYGERHRAAFHGLLAANQREAALEMGKRGIRYLVRAKAFDKLGGFASAVVTSTRDPGLLQQVIADLEAVASEVPAGKARWTLRTNLADALQAGRSDQALPLYALAAEEAESAEHWEHIGVIRNNWANALGSVGQLDRARETFLASAEAARRADSPRVNMVMSELEALRVLVMQGQAEQALPDIEAKLSEVRGYWALHQEGKPVPEAPNAEELARTLVGGLDIAGEANLALERWQVCLDVLDEIEKVERARRERACVGPNTR